MELGVKLHVEPTLFTSYDVPTYLNYNIPFDFKLKIENDDGTILLDDVLGGITRSKGTGRIKISDTSPIATGERYIIVHIYDTSNKLVESVRIPMLRLTGTSRTLYFRDENNDPIYGYVSVLVAGSNGIYYLTGSPYQMISIPAYQYMDKVWVEFIAYKNGKKYYYVERADRIPTSSQFVNLSPKESFRVELVFNVSKSELYKIIPSSYFSDRLADISLYSGFKQSEMCRVFADYLIKSLGLPPGDIVGYACYDYGTTMDVDVIIEHDIPVAIIVILALVGISFAVGFIVSGSLKDIKMYEATIRYVDYADEVTRLRYELINRIISKCEETYQDPDERLNCINTLSSAFATNMPDPNMTVVSNLLKELGKSESDVDKIKSLLFLALAGAIIISLILMFRR